MTSNRPDPARTRRVVEELWDSTIVPTLVEYIRIPNLSPHFDADWKAHGHMDRAAALLERWAREYAPDDATVELHQLDDRTPLLLVECPARGGAEGTVLLYGHLDKQPEMVGWDEDLGPWKPVLRDGKLYGRGGADDGYSLFASLAALRALDSQDVPRARVVVLIEGCEESGSYDLPAYFEHLSDRIGEPELMVALDSGCGNYDQLWSTTSLRGIAVCTVTVDVLTEGVHSGDASGIVPDGFRVLRQLLDRVEDSETGQVLLDELHVRIPAVRQEQARAAAAVLGDEVWTKFPFPEGAGPIGTDETELILNRTWRPALAVVGAAGLPEPARAGSVLRPTTTVKLSFRLPPTCDGDRAVAAIEAALSADPPYGAVVTLSDLGAAEGWNAPATEPWLERALNEASQTYFGREAAAMGEGGTIPFMGMLGKRFPDAQFVVTGVLGPGSNAHGPNEFLHLEAARNLTCSMAHVIASHAAR